MLRQEPQPSKDTATVQRCVWGTWQTQPHAPPQKQLHFPGGMKGACPQDPASPSPSCAPHAVPAPRILSHPLPRVQTLPAPQLPCALPRAASDRRMASFLAVSPSRGWRRRKTVLPVERKGSAPPAPWGGRG